jgi:hypothetical protein
MLSPKRLSRIFDRAAFIANLDDYKFVNLKSAPIWENWFFRNKKRAATFQDAHQYRYLSVRRLSKQRSDLHNDIETMRSGLVGRDAQIMKKYVSICRELWVLTGSSNLRDEAHELQTLLSEEPG